MKNASKLLILGCLVVGLLGCEQRTDKTDGGGVLLSISDFDGLPISVSASGSGGVAQIEQLTISNIVKDPTGSSSELMNVELESMEVVYTRADAGTRTPPTLVEFIFGVVPAGGTMTIDNMPFMRPAQIENPPISDPLDFGFDQETGSQVIRLTVRLRFFGRTLSGKEVESAPAYFTIDVVP